MEITLFLKFFWKCLTYFLTIITFLAQPTRKGVFKDKILKQNTINAGVMLFNIKKLREDNKDFELIHYLFVKRFTEQILMGYVCLPKIGYLPFKYGIFYPLY